MYSSRDIADIAYAVDEVTDVLRIDPVTVSVTGVYADEVRIQLHAGKKVLGLQVFQGVLHHSDQALAVLGLCLHESCKRSRTSGFNGIVAKSSYSELYI